jgi:hypothetical protein
VVENHSHRMLKILKLLWFNGIDFSIRDSCFFDQRKQNVSRQRFNLEVKLLSNLALLKALVDAPDVLPEGGIVVILNAVIRPKSKVNF